MKALLRNFILDECNKHKERYFDYLYELDKDIARKRKRTGKLLIPKQIRQPSSWKVDERFNPFKVARNW